MFLDKFILVLFHDFFYFFAHSCQRNIERLLNFVDFLFRNFIEYILFLWNFEVFLHGKYIIFKLRYLLPLFLFECLFFHFA